MSEQLIQDIQTRGWTPERVEEFVATATPDQLDNVSFNNMTVLFIIPRLRMRMRTSGDLQKLKLWMRKSLERDANPNIRNSTGETPLIALASLPPRQGDMLFFELFEILFEFGANINDRDNNGATAAFVIASRDSPIERDSQLALLIRKGANLNIQTNDGETPLMALIQQHTQGDYNRMTMSIIALPTIDLAIADNSGRTALMKATILGHGSIVKQLLDSRKDIGLNLKDNNGNTALMLASGIRSDDREWIIEQLVNFGADKSLTNNNGQTAYDILKDNSPYSPVLSLLVPPMSPVLGTVRSARGVRSTGTRPAHLAGPPVRRILVDQPPTPEPDIESDEEDDEADDDGGWVDARPIPPPASPLRIAVAPAASQGQRRRLPWDRQQSATPGQRRRRDETEDETHWEAKRKDIKVNVNQTVKWFDPIMQEEETVNIKDYLAESPNNIVIVYGPNLSQFFFTDRGTFTRQKNDATFFACKKADTMRPENIIQSKPLYDLKFIGLIDGGFCDVSVMTAKPTHQVFAIDNTGKTYPSFVSDNVLNRGADFVSGLHCQAGQERPVTMLVAATPVETALGGRRRSKRNRVTRRKKRAGKSNSKNKTKALRHKGHTKRVSSGRPKQLRHNKKTNKRH